MRRYGRIGALLLGLADGAAAGTFVLAPGDPILAIDTDPPLSDSSYPIAEGPANAVDGTLAKYLNFGGPGSGFIVTPAVGSTTVQSFQLTTANDAEGRDPTSWELWGTNEAIASADDSDGLGETWTLIEAGSIVLPSDRDTPGPVVSVANGSAYTSYKLLFPRLKAGPSFQIAEASLFEDASGMGPDVLSPGDPVRAVHVQPDSRFPGAEGPANVLDGDPFTKYLNFGRENSGFIVTPASGPSVVDAFQITTANDAPSRDPASWELYGTDDAVTSRENSQGEEESWTPIGSGPLDLPEDRLEPGLRVRFDNTEEYGSYRMIFPTVRDPGAADANSMQIAEIQFLSIPEPSAWALFAVGGPTLLAFAVASRRLSRRARRP